MTWSAREIETCNVVDDGCAAPAGYGCAGGIAVGTRAARCECFACGMPVCGNCSRRRAYGNHGIRRICNTCLRERASETA